MTTVEKPAAENAAMLLKEKNYPQLKMLQHTMCNAMLCCPLPQKKACRWKCCDAALCPKKYPPLKMLQQTMLQQTMHNAMVCLPSTCCDAAKRNPQMKMLQHTSTAKSAQVKMLRCCCSKQCTMQCSACLLPQKNPAAGKAAMLLSTAKKYPQLKILRANNAHHAPCNAVHVSAPSALSLSAQQT